MLQEPIRSNTMPQQSPWIQYQHRHAVQAAFSTAVPYLLSFSAHYRGLFSLHVAPALSPWRYLQRHEGGARPRLLDDSSSSCRSNGLSRWCCRQTAGCNCCRCCWRWRGRNGCCCLATTAAPAPPAMPGHSLVWGTDLVRVCSDKASRSRTSPVTVVQIRMQCRDACPECRLIVPVSMPLFVSSTSLQSTHSLTYHLPCVRMQTCCGNRHHGMHSTSAMVLNH